MELELKEQERRALQQSLKDYECMALEAVSKKKIFKIFWEIKASEKRFINWETIGGVWQSLPRSL